jgi:hypothetical protein
MLYGGYKLFCAVYHLGEDMPAGQLVRFFAIDRLMRNDKRRLALFDGFGTYGSRTRVYGKSYNAEGNHSDKE